MAKSAQIARDIKRDYGAVITVTNLQDYLKLGSYHTAQKMMKGVPTVNIGGKKGYWYEDVARKIVFG